MDSLIFSEAEGADLADVTRHQWYHDRLDIAKLRLKHATDSAEIAALKEEIAYYSNKIRHQDEGELSP